MGMWNGRERRLAEAVAELQYANPFLPRRIDLERQALGPAFASHATVWNRRADRDEESPNVLRLTRLVDDLIRRWRADLDAGAHPTAHERELYRDLVQYALYYRFHPRFLELIAGDGDGGDDADGGPVVPFLGDFRKAAKELLPDMPPTDAEVAHLLACFYQVRRAFVYIFRSIVGGSMATARLRATVWQSIFTHDMRRYQRALFARMNRVSALITGPSGTGKELVAQAIGRSQYIPCDMARRRFAARPERQFFSLHLAALSRNLIESELFGHRRGAFTGAVEDHCGWLEACGPWGTVFLDEIGEVDTGIQVKLLRVLEEGAFQRLGETETRVFRGKLVAATNRDLRREMDAGAFREDLYYRLCSDLIATPSLRQQLSESPDELPNLVLYLARRLVGDAEAPGLTDEVVAWIRHSMPPDYAWPGNVRELGQCVRNVMVRGHYRPAGRRRHGEDLAAALATGDMTADELMRRYCTLVYARTGNYSETARRLQLDNRTVKAKIDRALLEQLQADAGPVA